MNGKAEKQSKQGIYESRKDRMEEELCGIEWIGGKHRTHKREMCMFGTERI